MDNNCDHEYERFSIAFLGIRWQCVKCDKIMPACFTPTDDALTKNGLIDTFLDEHFMIQVIK